jgi:tryptophan-rich sensory protein
MDYGLFFTYLAACGAAAATGAMFSPGEWYKTLEKPTWTPPDWVFPVAWTTLYICMSLAAMRVGMSGHPAAPMALGFWAVQIALNTLWSPVFFGLRRMRAALIVVSVLWLAVAVTLALFLRIDWIAGLLFVPYLLWVTIATALNASVLRRNPAMA